MGKHTKSCVTYLILLVFFICFFFPIYWMVVTSIRPDREIYALFPSWIPKEVTFEHFKTIWSEYGFSIYFKNSLINALFTMAFSTSISIFGAYAIARFRFRGKNIFDQFILFVYLVPVILVIVPFFLTLNKLGLNNTRFGLIIGCTCYCLPFSLWVLKGFLREIPEAIEEAALVDGATRMQAFFRVILPLSIPGLIATSLFSFVLAWNDYLFALIIIDSEELKTLPLAISSYASGHDVSDGLLMAAGVITVAPAAVLYLLLQRYFVSGLSAGAVKG